MIPLKFRFRVQLSAPNCPCARYLAWVVELNEQLKWRLLSNAKRTKGIGMFSITKFSIQRYFCLKTRRITLKNHWKNSYLTIWIWIWFPSKLPTVICRRIPIFVVKKETFWRESDPNDFCSQTVGPQLANVSKTNGLTINEESEGTVLK